MSDTVNALEGVQDAAQVARIDTVLAEFDLRRLGTVERVTTGTLNENFRVNTSTGRWFVRHYRTDNSAEQIGNEHDVMRWAGERGIPVVQPLTDRHGRSVIAFSDGSLWSLQPWISGRTVTRGALSAGEALTLGEMHGRLHAVLAQHPTSSEATFAMAWDRASSMAILERVQEVATEVGAAPWVRAGIALQMQLLAREPLRFPNEFSALPCQMVHGDYHDQQVLLDKQGRIAAVVDWELCGPQPRIWELARALAFAGLYFAPGLEGYLAGYRRHTQLSAWECRLGMDLWWQSRMGGTWVWTAHFLQGPSWPGKARVAELFPATIQTLQGLTDPAWRRAISERVVAAATD